MRVVNAVEVASLVPDSPDVAHSLKGALVVVGGHSRGVGKTTTIVEFLSSRPGGRWAAVKVSAHRHTAPHDARVLVEQDFLPDPCSQTGRYLIAGADRAYLCRTPASLLTETATFVNRLRGEGFNVIVESNRLVDFVSADVVLFAVAPAVADWKASSGVMLPRLHAFVIRDPDATVALDAVRALAGKGRLGFAPGHGGEAARLDAWLAARLQPYCEEPRRRIATH